MEVVKLPEPKLKGSMSLEEAIKKRRSERRLSSKELSIEYIGQLCWAAQGITQKARRLRAAPSAKGYLWRPVLRSPVRTAR